MNIQKSAASEVREFIDRCPTWQIENEKLSKTFVFKDFLQAFEFMTQVALIAEQHQHHPEWLNIYNRVCVQLTTHESAGITQRDFELANAMDEIVANAPSLSLNSAGERL